MEEIAEQVRNLKASPLYEYRKEEGYSPVIGEGDVDAAIMFVGEAPGRREAETGRPFVGRAGRRLEGLLASIGLNRADVYITNVVKDRPPGNRDPRVGEIEVYEPFLRQQIEIVEPEVIVTLGRFAMRFMLRTYDLPQQSGKIGELHGEVLEAEGPQGTLHVVPLYHPAAALYNQELDDVIQEDFQVLSQFV
jgi:DNA polymerase